MLLDRLSDLSKNTGYRAEDTPSKPMPYAACQRHPQGQTNLRER